MLRVHLGFSIPLVVTLMQGARAKAPGPGVCPECGLARAKVYIRGDNTLYCSECIRHDFAAAVPDPAVEQRHPDAHPEEIIFDVMRLKGGTDDFELRAVAAGPYLDPRMYDKALP